MNIGFESLKEMSIGQIIELEKDVYLFEKGGVRRQNYPSKQEQVYAVNPAPFNNHKTLTCDKKHKERYSSSTIHHAYLHKNNIQQDIGRNKQNTSKSKNTSFHCPADKRV